MQLKTASKLGLTLGLMAVGLHLTDGSARAQTISESVKIGIVGPFSGNSAEQAQRIGNAVVIAVEEANAAGGLFGKPIKIEYGDDESQPEKATLVSQRLIDDESVLGVIGPLTSASALASGPLYQRAGLAFLTPTATNPRITEQGWTVAFRVAGRDDREGPAAGLFINGELKPKKVVAISDKTAFQAGNVNEVVRKLKELGTDATIEEVSAQDRDLSAIITRIKTAGADVVYLGMAPGQCALLLKQAAQAGVKFTPVSHSSNRERELFIKGSNGNAEGAYLTYNARDPRTVPEAKSFIERFEKRFKSTVSAYEPQAFDATNILIKAIRTAGLKDGKVDREKVLAAIRSQDGYPGVMGINIKFDKKGDVEAAPIGIYKVVNDDFVLVRTVSP